MNMLTVPFSPKLDRDTSIGEVADLMDGLKKNEIGYLPWPKSFSYKPEVKFAIAHSNDCVYLKYYVKEKAIKANYYEVNDPVHKDSCVEFFIGLANEENYYNFEFNCVGTCHAGFGKDRHGREPIADDVLKQVKTMTVITPSSGTELNIKWELTLMLPAEVFSKHTINTFNGISGRGNLFKCGDELPTPHFVAWNNIDSETPNFHLSQFFGQFQFE